MTKYRKKPVVVDAFQFESDEQKYPEWFEKSSDDGIIKFEYLALKCVGVSIYTLEGRMIAHFGDFIIKGINGEIYPCKPDIFKKTYEVAE